MATKAVNLKMEESRIADLKQVAAVFHMSMTDIINEALDVYIPTMKKDPLYKLTANVKEASKAESEEILSEIESLTDDDLEISTVKHVTVINGTIVVISTLLAGSRGDVYKKMSGMK